MADATGMGPNLPSPRLDPNCQCICHTQPGVMHVAACCSAPSLASSPEVAALIREAEARGMERAANVDWQRGRDVIDPAPDFLSDWQRGLVAGQQMMRDAILAEAASIRAAKATP